MPRIDIIGPPGVGKTHFYEALERLSNTRQLKSNQNLRADCVKEYLPRLWMVKLINPNIDFEKLVFDKIQSKQLKKENSIANKFDQIFNQKIKNALSNNGGLNISSLTLFNYLIGLLSEIGHYKDTYVNTTAYFDESLTHHMEISDLINCHASGIIDVAADGVISLKCRPEVIASRLITRKKIIDRHIGLSAEDILADTIYVTRAIEAKENTLRQLGIPILEIDTEEPSVISATAAIKWIKDLVKS